MKTYDVPEEIKLLMEKSLASETLRDLYTKVPFGFKKARKCARDHIKYRRLFWSKVHEIYPDLPDAITYHVTLGKIEVKD